MSNKLLTILMGVLFLFVLGLGGGLFLIWQKVGNLPAAGEGGQAAAESEKAKAEQAGKIVPLETFIVNLADPGGSRYLRVTMDLEVTGGKAAEEEIAARVPHLRDAVLMILPTKRYADISTTEGKTAMREELAQALNGLLAKARVNRIYFKEFVIQ
ncbi:MAG: flagellar basal body-associated FliL family protein [Desulfobacterales bacterium]